MIQLTQVTRVGAPPEELWRFFAGMDENYTRWHPEHLRWRWLTSNPMELGAIWFADEYFDWMRLWCRWFVIESEPNRRFAFRLGLPYALVRAGGSFTFVPTPDGGTEITEEFHFGFEAPLIRPVVDAVLRLAMPLDAFRRHMVEEGQGFVRLLGAPAQPAEIPA